MAGRLVRTATMTALAVRRDIASWTGEERADLVVRWNLAKASGAYDERVRLHRGAFDRVHHNPLFLPWHRWFVWDMENLLRGLRPSAPEWALPYWNATIPEGWDAIFTVDFLCARRGDLDRDYCLGDGWLSAWETEENAAGGCVARVDNASVPAPVWSPPLSSSSYAAFAAALERGLHDRVHLRLGGTMHTPSSADDPVFWLHHAFVDKVWSDAQAATGAPSLTLDPTTPLPDAAPLSTVGQVQDVRADLGYRYA